MKSSEIYQSPLSLRYASKEMSSIFSSQFKYSTWRKLWVGLAKAQKSLGLSITDKQIRSMEKNIDNIDFEAVNAFEKKYRHDVMAHIFAFAECCPDAKGIIHLGATSAYVTDNTDIIQMKEAMHLLKGKFVLLLRELSAFAKKYADLGTLSYTHLQPAQPTTVGKRACIWLQDFLLDFQDLLDREKDLRFLGVKGATGTQASFLTLFSGNKEKVKKLDQILSKEFGFEHFFSISGQTYTRKQDVRILSILSSFAASAHKFGTDLRLLAHLKEMDEPHEAAQIGSSAMPHKQNPMRSERICSLSRFLISLNENPAYNLATQWLERSLDDSANRRIVIPEAFLCTDAILNLLINVVSNLTLYPKVIQKHLEEELPFMALENIMLEAVKKGKGREQIHERLRLHSKEASRGIKEMGKECDLLERIEKDASIGLSKKELEKVMKVKNFFGLSEDQTLHFLEHEVNPVLEKFRNLKTAVPQVEL